MKRYLIAFILGSVALSALAATSSSSKAAYDAARKAAATRYSDDKKLCAEESSSGARMQCLRDARSEYDKALVEAKQASMTRAAAPTASVAPACDDCGKVTAVKVVEKKGESSPLGLIAGGVAGAVLGHQVGQGRGKDLATIAGAAGGAYAGHKIEENVRAAKSWVVAVQFETGKTQEFSFAADPGMVAGDAVKLSGNTVVRR